MVFLIHLNLILACVSYRYSLSVCRLLLKATVSALWAWYVLPTVFFFTSFYVFVFLANKMIMMMMMMMMITDGVTVWWLQVIAAEGENRAARALKDASDIINESSSALQLRYLQTLNSISAEKNSTIIFPLPTELLEYFARWEWAKSPATAQRLIGCRHRRVELC